MLDGTDPMQPRPPDLNLFQEPLIGFRLASIAPDNHLLCQTAAIRTKHRMQSNYRAIVRRQHRL
ncbi:hypothetical protein D3C73_1410740 [compost metagenome]